MFPIGVSDVDLVGFSQVKPGDLVQLPNGGGKFGLVVQFHAHPQIVWLDAGMTEIDLHNRQPRQLVRFRYAHLGIGALSEFGEKPDEGGEVAGRVGIRQSGSLGIFALFDRLGRDASGQRRAKPGVGFLDLKTFSFEESVTVSHYAVLETWALLIGVCDGAAGERFRIYDNVAKAGPPLGQSR